MKNNHKDKTFLKIILVAVIIAVSLTGSFVYNYVKSEKTMLCEGLAGRHHAQDKVLKISIAGSGHQSRHLIVSEVMINEGENIIADLKDFKGDTLQVQSIFMNIEKLDLAQDCYISDKQISLFFRIFGQFSDGHILNVSVIGEVPAPYRREDISGIVQGHTWRKIWIYALGHKNKGAVYVSNTILDLRRVPYDISQEYKILLKNNGQMSIVYPFRSNIRPARQK